LKEAKNKINDTKIVVTTTDFPYISIKEELESNGFVENKDFCILSRFLGEWYLKYKDQLCVSKIDTIITSRCTLSCPHCAMYIPQCKKKMDYPLEELCNNFDTVFSAIDYVMEYSLFGGEPLIYGELGKLIEYLMSHYGNRIGRLVLISNGKAKLTDEVLRILKKYNAMLSISDYVHFNDYRNIQKNLISQLEKYGIEYSYNEELVWKDMGYPDNPPNIPDSRAREHFRTCGHSTFCVNKGILYFCDAMLGAEINTDFPTREDDVINIASYMEKYGLNKTKERIFRYIMGDINELGCPSFCQQCRGVGDDNNIIIEAGS
jgi:sulfatase maturation enzyme AslB (radical SAM superfamily)